MASPGGRVYRGVFFAVLLTGTLALSFVVIKPFLSAIAWAIVLAVGFRSPWGWLNARLPRRRSLAALIGTVLIALVVLVPAAWLSAVLAGQASRAVTRFTDQLKTQHVTSFDDLVSVPQVRRALEWVAAKTGFTAEDLFTRAGELAAGASALLAKFSGQLVLGLFDTLLTFLTTMFLLFFLLRDGAEMAEAFFEMLPLPSAARTREMARLSGMMTAIFRGSLLCAFFQGFTGGVGWAIAGLPSAVLAGSLMAILSLLPVGGTALVWAPGAVYVWMSGHHGKAIFLVIWGLVVTSFLADNVLKPLLISGQELNTLVVFLGVFGGLGAFGLLGLFIGPMALAVMVTLVDALRDLSKASRREDEIVLA